MGHSESTVFYQYVKLKLFFCIFKYCVQQFGTKNWYLVENYNSWTILNFLSKIWHGCVIKIMTKKILVVLILSVISCVFGIASICVGWTIGTGLWGTFFTWFAGYFGYYGARNSKSQTGLLTAHMAFVRFVFFCNFFYINNNFRAFGVCYWRFPRHLQTFWLL